MIPFSYKPGYNYLMIFSDVELILKTLFYCLILISRLELWPVAVENANMTQMFYYCMFKQQQKISDFVKSLFINVHVYLTFFEHKIFSNSFAYCKSKDIYTYLTFDCFCYFVII